MRKKTIKINDSIHGFIIFPEFITSIVDSKEIQRLTRIRQLSGANSVFPGANHSRFAHSIGVAWLAQQLAHNLRDYQGVDLTDDDIKDCTVAALCHDLGHGPFSHNFESLLMEYNGKTHEDYTEWIIKDSELGDVLEDLGFNKDYIRKVATGREVAETNITGSILGQVISGPVNVDSMDYLIRDNYHCGTEGRSIDINRLMLSLDVLEAGLLGVNIKSLIALEGYLLARISSFRTIYFHKTCRSVQLMLGEAMKKIVPDTGLLDYSTPDDYTYWDDHILWAEMLKNKNSQAIIEKLKRRQLLKMCYESNSQITKKQIKSEHYVERIAERSNVPLDMIYIDLPSSSNVPYSHSNITRANTIFSFKRNAQGEKEMVRLEDHSLFFSQLQGQLQLIRVYTWPQYRRQVTDAAKAVLGPEESLLVANQKKH